MKTVKKYTTFEDLKSSEKKSLDGELSLKKHKAFEKVMKDFSSIDVHKNDPVRSK